jgi:hypothetical protein
MQIECWKMTTLSYGNQVGVARLFGGAILRGYF